MTYRVHHGGGVVTVALAGEFDLAAVEPVHALLAELEATDPRVLVLDLQSVSFLDSSGIRALIDAHQRSVAVREFAILDGSGPAHRSLTMTGVDHILTVVSSLDELDVNQSPEDVRTD